MQIVSKGDNLHEMLKSVFWEKEEKNMLSAEFANKVVIITAADDIFIIFFFFFLVSFCRENKIWHFMWIVC